MTQIFESSKSSHQKRIFPLKKLSTGRHCDERSHYVRQYILKSMKEYASDQSRDLVADLSYCHEKKKPDSLKNHKTSAEVEI